MLVQKFAKARFAGTWKEVRFAHESARGRTFGIEALGGTGILKIGKALGIGTGTVQRVVMEQPRPFDVGASA